MVEIKLKDYDGNEQTYNVREFNPIARSKVLSAHINTVAYAKYENGPKVEGQEQKTIVDFLKNPDGILDFLVDCVKFGVPDLDLEKIPGSEFDKVINDILPVLFGQISKN